MPKSQSLRGTKGAGDEGQGIRRAAEALAVPIAIYRVHSTHYKPRIYKNLGFGKDLYHITAIITKDFRSLR